jgi:hypothetical protein
VEAGRGGPVKTIKVIRGLPEKLGADMEDHRRKSPGPSQDTPIHSFKHLYNSVKVLQDTFGTE